MGTTRVWGGTVVDIDRIVQVLRVRVARYALRERSMYVNGDIKRIHQRLELSNTLTIVHRADRNKHTLSIEQLTSGKI